MHAAIHLVPVLAAEKSKLAFYVAGGLLAVWAVVVSVGLGMRAPDFPGNVMGQRAVIAITVLLVLAATSTAVITSGVSVAAGGVKGNTASETAKSKAPAASAVGSVPQNGAAASALAVAADPSGQLKFDKTALKAPAGKLTINFTNGSQVPHNLTISGENGTVVGHTPTGTGTFKLTLTLRPGSYVYFCSVPRHRQAGMQGTLVVG